MQALLQANLGLLLRVLGGDVVVLQSHAVSCHGVDHTHHAKLTLWVVLAVGLASYAAARLLVTVAVGIAARSACACLDTHAMVVSSCKTERLWSKEGLHIQDDQIASFDAARRLGTWWCCWRLT